MVIQLFSEESVSEEQFPVVFVQGDLFKQKGSKKILETKIEI